MATVFDVAEYILEKQGEMTAMKLQKLAYYAQAWHAVWEEKALFQSPIQAWANGPVVPELFNQHRGVFLVKLGFFSAGSAKNLTKKETESIDAILKFYGDKNPQWLSDLTHMEDPWLLARQGLDDREVGNKEITLSSMMDYYGSL